MTKPTRKTQGEKQHPGTRKVGKIVKKMLGVKINSWKLSMFWISRPVFPFEV